MEGGGQVLAACDVTAKCLPQDPYVMAQRAQCQPNSYIEMQKNGLPQITILKRNAAVPVNPLDLDMNKRYFHPIYTNQATINQSTQTNGPVELHVTNFDFQRVWSDFEFICFRRRRSHSVFVGINGIFGS